MHEGRLLPPLHHLRSPWQSCLKFWLSTKLPDCCTMNSWQMSFQPSAFIWKIVFNFMCTKLSFTLDKYCRVTAEITFGLSYFLRGCVVLLSGEFTGDNIILGFIVATIKKVTHGAHYVEIQENWRKDTRGFIPQHMLLM